MNEQAYEISEARPDEFRPVGRMLHEVYAALEGFPRPSEQPAYYEMLLDVGRFTAKPATRLLVARATDGGIAGSVLYFGDMAEYGAGPVAGIADASGIRLLGVAPSWQRRGVGRALTQACLELAWRRDHSQVILHTTAAMKNAWRMYEGLGFARDASLDFDQKGLTVYGFRKMLA